MPRQTHQEWDTAFGRRLRAFRRRAGLTQQDMAALLDISFQMIQKYETGRCRVPANRITILARVLETSVDALLLERTGSGRA